MYCVKCGVKLEEGTKNCPLCGTLVVDPYLDTTPAKDLFKTDVSSHYNPSLYPLPTHAAKYTLLSFFTVLFLTAALCSLLVCLVTLGEPAWSGYVMLGCALGYVVLILPLWFQRPYPIIFIPIWFAAAGGYLLYICLKTGGHWFLSFAFPVTGILFLLTYAAMWLIKLPFRARTRLMLSGIYLFLLGGSTMLIEFFQHITFDSRMFLWSLYSTSILGFLGIFLFVAAFIRPLRRYLHKKLFL